MKNKKILMIHITIFCLAFFIVIYPYIVPFFYHTFSFWGDPTEKITGVPSAYDGITADVKNFNYSITHFTKISFYNPSAFIVIFTAYANIIYRLIVFSFFKKIKNHRKLITIDLLINIILAIFFIIRAVSIWYNQYYMIFLK